MNTITPFYKFRAEAGDEPTGAELLIFDVIGDWEDMGEISAKGFARDLSALPKSVKRLDIHINSPGGSLSEAQAIYSRLADHKSDKNVYIDGVAASAASIVAMVGHKIYIRANANMMIHSPMAITIGNAEAHRTSIAALDSMTESMLNVYAKRTKVDREEIRGMLTAETWFSAQQAVDKGFADEVRGVVKAAAVIDEKRVIFNGVTFDLSRFHNVPAFTAQQQQTGEHTMPEATTTQQQTQQPPEQPKPGEETKPKPAEPAPQPAPPPPPTQAATTTTVNEFDKGVKAERDRIAALQKYDKPATHDIVVKAIAEGKTVADITDELFSALEKSGQQTARRADATALSDIQGGDTTPNNGDDSGDFGVRLTKAVQNKLKARGRTRVLNGKN